MRMPCMVKNLSTKQEILSVNFSFAQRHNTPTHRHKKTKIKVVKGSDGKAWAFLNLI